MDTPFCPHSVPSPIPARGAQCTWSTALKQVPWTLPASLPRLSVGRTHASERHLPQFPTGLWGQWEGLCVHNGDQIPRTAESSGASAQPRARLAESASNEGGATTPCDWFRNLCPREQAPPGEETPRWDGLPAVGLARAHSVRPVHLGNKITHFSIEWFAWRRGSGSQLSHLGESPRFSGPKRVHPQSPLGFPGRCRRAEVVSHRAGDGTAWPLCDRPGGSTGDQTNLCEPPEVPAGLPRRAALHTAVSPEAPGTQKTAALSSVTRDTHNTSAHTHTRPCNPGTHRHSPTCTALTKRLLRPCSPALQEGCQLNPGVYFLCRHPCSKRGPLHPALPTYSPTRPCRPPG